MDKVNINKILQTFPLQVNSKKYDKIIELSSKLSTYEDRLEKIIINKSQIQTMSLHIT